MQIDTAVRNWSYTYDNNNDLVQITGPQNVKIRYEYDNKHNLTAIITPNEIASSETDSNYIIKKILIQYDDNNKLVKTTDRKGLITLINYDPVNRKTGIVCCEGTDDSTTKEYYYDDLNRATKEEDIKPLDNSIIKTTAYEYGDENNKALATKIITAQGTSDEQTQQYTYDTNGNTLTSTDSSMKTTSYTYENNFVKTTTDPDGTVKTNLYDTNYNLTGDGQNTYIYSGGLLTEQKDKDGNVTTYTYDDQGNSIGITSSDGETTSKTYDNLERLVSETSQNKTTSYEYNLRDQKTKVTEAVDGTDKVTEYYYDAENNVIKEVTPDNVQNIYTYDCYGNVIETKVQNPSGSIFIKGTSEYYGDTDQLKKYTDSDGKITSYQYNEAGTAKSITDACGNTINYDYDKQDRLTLVSASVTGDNGTRQVSNSYTYENDKIKTITHNGFTYSFGYDDNGNNTTVNVGSQDLVNNTYTSNNKVQETTYGNNQKIGYTYDADKVTGKKYNDELKFEYSYDEDSKISVLKDHINGVDYNYSYDETGRLNKIADSNNNYIQYGYRDTDIVSSVISYINGVNKETDYTYNEADKPGSMTWGESSLNYNYDEIGRLGSNIISTGSSTYITNCSYKPGSNGATTEKVESISNNGNAISYTYYDNGNIKTITSDGKVISYKYDEIGELIREDNQVLDKTISYSYDTGGNITGKTEYPYTTGTPENASKTYSYGYNDSNWKDKLTSFDGKEITYDEIGNPTNYDGYTYTWEAGRQLSGISGNGKNITYKYNDFGIRTEKTVEGVTTKYYLDGDKVILEDNGTDKIYYTYDSSDKLVSMNLNGVEYYYVRNGQGDIISLVDKTGAEVTSYTYDSWGKLISIEGTLKDTVGAKNPYRYRGYSYDTETGLYYLQSRYYNAEMGRFINIDDTSVLQGKQGELPNSNLFSYCGDNPVNRSDFDGHDWKTILISWVSYVLAIMCWNPQVRGVYVALSIGISFGVLAYSWYCYNSDLKYYKKLYNNGKNSHFNYRDYAYYKDLADLAFYTTVAACVLNVVISATGYCFKTQALKICMGVLGILCGFVSGNVAWALDIGYTTGYNGLKRRLARYV